MEPQTLVFSAPFANVSRWCPVCQSVKTWVGYYKSKADLPAACEDCGQAFPVSTEE